MDHRSHAPPEQTCHIGNSTVMHLMDRGEYLTYCGRDSANARDVQAADIGEAINDPTLCKRCYNAALR